MKQAKVSPATVTIRDVARISGVSVKTVSRVINNEPRVRAATRARVLQTVADLDFHPNPFARGLHTKRMHTLGLIVPNIANPFFAKGIEGCASQAEQHGYNLFLGSARDDRDREIRHIRALLMQRVSGLILWVSNLTPVDLLEIMERAKYICPTVFIDRPANFLPLQRVPYASILIEQESVGMLATEHLLDEGRHRIAYLGLNSTRPAGWVNTHRLDGYRKALLARSESVDERLIATVEHATIRAGALAMASLLAQRPLPDAVFAYNDLMAVGALLVCQQRRLLVPDEIAIVGVDDTEMAAVTSPPMTTVRLHQRSTGEQAAALVLKLVHADSSLPPTPVPSPDLPCPELIIRGSSTARAVSISPLADLLLEERDEGGTT